MKKLFYRFVLFFRTLYVSLLKRRYLKVMTKADKTHQKTMRVLKQKDPMYVHYLSNYTRNLLSKTDDAVRELMPLIGKNPNYIPPPPPAPKPPPPIDESRAAWMVDTKERPTRMNVVGSYDPWIKKPVDHPILRSRAAWEAKQEAAKAPPQAAIDPPMVTSTTEIGSDAIDSLREAVHQVEQACNLESDKKPE